MGFLGIVAGQEAGQFQSDHGMLGGALYAHGFGGGEGTQLAIDAVDHHGGQHRHAEVVAQHFLGLGSLPGAADVSGAVAFAHHADGVGRLGHDEVFVLDQVHQGIGDGHAFFAAQLDARGPVFPVSTEEGAAIGQIEGGQVIAVAQGEGHLALGQHGVQGEDVFFREHAFIVVHEIGVGGDRHAVQAVGVHQAVHQGFRIVFLHILHVFAAPFGQGVGLAQGFEARGAEQEHVGSRFHITRNQLLGVGFAADAEFKSDIPFGMGGVEFVAQGVDPGTQIGVLVFRGRPYPQGKRFRAVGKGGGGAKQQAQGQQQGGQLFAHDESSLFSSRSYTKHNCCFAVSQSSYHAFSPVSIRKIENLYNI